MFSAPAGMSRCTTPTRGTPGSISEQAERRKCQNACFEAPGHVAKLPTALVAQTDRAAES